MYCNKFGGPISLIKPFRHALAYECIKYLCRYILSRYFTMDEKFRFQSDTYKLFYNMIIRWNSANMESIFHSNQSCKILNLDFLFFVYTFLANYEKKFVIISRQDQICIILRMINMISM